MASSGPVREKGFGHPSPAIYGAPRDVATNVRMLERIIVGTVAGAATWMIVALLGAPRSLGIGLDAGLIPASALGAILALTRFRALFPSVSFGLLCLAIVVGYTDIVTRPLDKFVRDDPLPASADAIVVLSSGVTADGYLNEQGMDRTLKGVTIAQTGIAPVLLFTREERDSRGFTASNAPDQLRFASIARLSRVLVTRPVKSTRDEALAVRDVARYRGWKRIILVTSPFHSRRACATFEHVGLAVSCSPSDSRDVAIKRLVFPRDRLIAFGLSLYETAGTLRYRQMGWM